MEAVSLRRAGPPDMVALNTLLNCYFREWAIQEPDSADLLRTQLSWPALGFYVAERGNQLVACALCRPCPSVPDAAECKRLYVIPEARGLGIATNLMQRIEAEAETAGYTTMYLDTKDEFQVAIAFYTRHGYLPIPRYNDNAQATLFFRKLLLQATATPL